MIRLDFGKENLQQWWDSGEVMPGRTLMTYFLKSRMALLAGMLLASLGAQAGSVDQQVEIMKANDSRTLTVRYSGAKTALIELRINGVSVATRAVSDGKSSGESNFMLDTAKLNDGENNVEIRLYDEAGRVVGSEKTTVMMDRSANGPVFLNKPQTGATVEGLTEISVGFKSTMKGAYVSFFVNDEFKALKNYAPYTYLWDTNTVTNGWHEVEAWVVDEGSNTFRTQRMRVFVNNPGGRTERQGELRGGSAGFEPRETLVKPTKVVKPLVVKTTAPVLTKKLEPLVLALSENSLTPIVSRSTGTKPAPHEQGIMTGPRLMRPTGQRVAGVGPSKGVITKPVVVLKPVVKAVVKPIVQVKVTNSTLVAKHVPVVKTSPPTVKSSITMGTKLPNIGYYPIFVDGSAVSFDVMPRVTDGVALTPFRHLFEHVGGKVSWKSGEKVVDAKGLGQSVAFKIGQEFAMVNGVRMEFERATFLETGRSIVPLSFVQKLLNVNIQYDPSTKHVLITKSK